MRLWLSSSAWPQSVAKVFRIFRVFRVAKLAKYSRDTRQLISTLYTALPSVANVGVLLLLIFYIYAIVAMQLCGNTAYDVRLLQSRRLGSDLVVETSQRLVSVSSFRV